jgi:hypothetical protein
LDSPIQDIQGKNRIQVNIDTSHRGHFKTFLFTGQAYPGYPQPNPYQPPQQPGYDPSGKPLNPPYMDENDPNYKASGFGFDDKSIRAGFIRRVYSILSVS